MKHYADCTKYPHVYGDSYWGCFEADPTDNQNAIVFANRNAFVEDYHIQRYVKARHVPEYVHRHVSDPGRGRHQSCDHDECYLDNDGNYVIIVSPYGLPYGQEKHRETLTKMGFTLIYPLYSYMAETFIMTVPKRRKRTRSEPSALLAMPVPRSESDMPPNPLFYVDRSKYPTIFEDTHWGHHYLDGRDTDPQRSIGQKQDYGQTDPEVMIANRNTFVEYYRIVNYVQHIYGLPNYVWKHLSKAYDHCSSAHAECYVNQDRQYVVLFNMYNDYQKSLIPEGWQRFDKVYFYMATSYVKIIPKPGQQQKRQRQQQQQNTEIQLL